MRIPWEQISLHDGFKNKPNLSQFELFFYQFSKEAGFVWVQSTLTSISNKHFQLTHYQEKLSKRNMTWKYQSNSICGQFMKYSLSKSWFHLKIKLNLFEFSVICLCKLRMHNVTNVVKFDPHTFCNVRKTFIDFYLSSWF